MRVLVCGGRDFDNMAHLFAVLGDYEITLLIHGGARGADTLAGLYAEKHNIPVRTFPVSDQEWIDLGKRAGVLRNQRMLDEGKPELVIAFPGNRGTADMVRRARLAGVRVITAGGRP